MEKSLSIILLFLASFTVLASAKLEPIYENGNYRKLYKIGKPLMFACKADEARQIKWKKGDVEIENKDNFKIKSDEGKLIIENASEQDAGNYSCNLGNESHKFEALAQVVVGIPKNIYVVENEKLEIQCTVRGSQPKITWYYSNTTDRESRFELGQEDRIKLEEHGKIDDSKLVIEHSEMSDRGNYYCVGTNDLMEDLNIAASESEGFVRVKDKLAALWPFLGICAEVFILCTIILIYEKRRNKTDLDESDTDQSPDQKDQKR